ncbi:MAG: tetratricopeptide repeat protein [Endomicrobiaceae bacterium]|nr:tetratricopeptide repeat protein [Endomicrobiaceae bacterium]
MGTKIALFIGMFLFFFILHYIFYSIYSYKTRSNISGYGSSVGLLFLFVGAFASLIWTALIFSHNYRGLLLPLTTIPSVLLAFSMLIRILVVIFAKSSQKKGHLEDEQKKNQDNYLSLTRGRHYDYIINIYNNKSNPLVTQRDYEIACIYSKKSSIIDILKSQNKYYELAIYYFLQNNYKEAIGYFNQADSNSSYKFFYNKALCLFHLEKYQDAIEYFDKAIEISPNTYAYFNRALAKSRLNDATGTLQDLKLVIDDKDIRNSIKIKRKLDFIDKVINSK